jgi:hypothetical protein
MRILDGIFDGVSYEKFQAVFFLQDSVRTQKGIQVFEVFDLLFSRFSWLWRLLCLFWQGFWSVFAFFESFSSFSGVWVFFSPFTDWYL